MPTSATDPANGAPLRLVFVDGSAAPGRWLLLDGGRVAGRGDADAPPPPAPTTVLAVPGDEVTLHWLDLDESLAPAQAAAAARLMLADASAEPLAAMHVAVGRPEQGRTPAALVPAARMTEWLGAAAHAGLDPDAVVPSPLLLPVPAAGFVRRDRGGLADYRGAAAAFALEPDIAEALVGDVPVEPIGAAEFEAGLGALAARPALNLRQGAFARRRPWRVERGGLRRIALFALVLALLTLAVQVTTILAYTFAADRAEAEAQALAAPGSGSAEETGPGFGGAAGLLFEAVRATPNVQLAQLDYRAGGTMVVAVTADSPATLAALQTRLESSGLAVTPGQRSTAGGRLGASFTLRAR